MKRLLSAVVCLAMLLTMLPAVAAFSAQAADDVTYTYVGKTPASIIPADNGTKGAWYNNGTTFNTAEGAANYFEIVEAGCKDAGAFHVYQDDVTNTDMSMGVFIGGQPAGTYTVKLSVKGDLGLLDQTCKFYPFGCDALVPNLHNALGTTDVAGWTEVSYTVDVAADFYYLIFSFSKYNWKTDFYVDNIQLINSNGVDVLAGAGNFYTTEEVTTTSSESGQWPLTFDTSDVSGAYSSFAGKWTAMYPTGAPDNSADSTWPSWDSTHYGEIVADGYNDAGSLRLVSVPGKNTGVAINAGMTVGETYTLGFYAKGTVNTGKVLGMYGNGDGTIIADTASFGAGWNYYEHTFTAGMSQINIVAADWGDVDILIDNITLKNSAGVDLLAGCGDFYTAVNPSLTPVADTLDASKLDDLYDAPTNEWVPFTPYAAYQDTWPVWEAGVNYGQIVADGHNEVGALHLVSAGGKNTGVVINPGMNAGESYTLGMWVKGTAASNKMLALYGNGDPCLIGNPEYCGNVCLSAVPADWTYIEKTFTAVQSCLAIFAADWGVTDIYIDNITLKNAAGTDLLAGHGDFCTLEEPSEDTSKEITSIDTSVAYPSWGGAPKGQWSVMYESGTPAGTWPAWDDTHYGEIVAEGYKDIGALHLVSDATKNTGVAIGADMVAGESYKLSFWAKGTANTGRVLFSYGNGDVIIIETGDQLGADWTHYEATIVANRNQLNLVAADWGSVDIYIDNVTLTDAEGNDLLEGWGNFCQEIKEEEPDVPPVEPDVEGLAVIGDKLERVFRWYWNDMTYEETDHSLVEIAPYGAEDNGSLHIWQSSAAPADTKLCLTTSMASDLASGSYTLTMKVKGTFYNTEGFYVYPAYCSEAQLAELSVNNKLKTAEGVSYADGAYTTDGWIDLSWTLPANPKDGENGFMYLALQFSKYNVGEYWIDNIRVLDPAGNDVLGGAGSFMDSGSEYWPIILPATGAEILNSNTMYYQVSAGNCSVSISNHVESGITCGDQHFTVTHNGVTQSASNKNVTMQMAPAADGQPIVFAVTSSAGSVEIPSGIFEMMQRAGEFNIYDVVITELDCAHEGIEAVEWTQTKAPTFTEEGEQVKYCAHCGEVAATESIPMLTASVYNWNIALDDDLVATFHLNVSDYAYANGAQVKIVMGNRTVTGALDSLQKDDFGMAMAVVHVPAPYMTENMVITVSVDDSVSQEMVYTVRQYADTILKLEAYSAYHGLVKEMLNYGAAAQVRFGVNTDNLANKDIQDVAAAEVPASIEGRPSAIGSVPGISFYGASLVCEDKTAVRLYFTVTGNIADYAVEGHDFVNKDGMYYIEIAGIRPENLDDIIEITVTDQNGNAMTVSYSPLQYMVRMNVKGSSEMQALVKALYNYHLAAQALRSAS